MRINIKSVFSWIAAHKMIAGIIALVIVGGGYYGYSKYKGTASATQYVTQQAEKGTLVVSVSGTGQISALNQIDVKPEGTGRIVSIPVSNGQYVYAGQILGRLDTQDASKAVRDAAVNLDSAKLQLTILKESGANIDKLVSDGYNDISNTFLDLPTVIAGLSDALHDKTIVSYLNLVDPQDKDSMTPLVTAAENSYQSARAAYDDTFASYQLLSRTDSQDKIVAFMEKTSDTSTKIADAVKNATNVLDYVNNYYAQHGKTLFPAYATLITKYKSNLSNFTSIINPHITALSADISSISNAPLNIASQELSLQQRENALADANDALANYIIRAPFSGVVANIVPKVGDTASPGATFATIISSGRYATISLNEVDISKVKVGQKATLTFDAIDGLSLTGKVIEMDSIGTVSQGVVTYNVKIGLDASDKRVLPGMSVSAAIITNVRQDVILVPNSAVKSQNNESYVEVVDMTKSSLAANGTSSQTETGTLVTKRQTVQVGAVNDTMTEIVSGLNEGDTVVVRSVTASTQTTQSSQGGGIRLPGLGGGR